tara:strand:- start:3130 stop:4671 length:1542 start_codon:yes stop_codon:yes gene_type:complete
MSDLPDVLKVAPLNRPVDQECSTDILQPTTISQSQCRFVLPNVGILDANSQLHVSQIVVNSANQSTDSNSYYPSTVGACALISRCYLTIGGAEICDVRDVNQFINWKRHHYSNEYKRGTAMPHQAGNDVYMGSAGLVDALVTDQQKKSRGFLPPFGTIGKETSEYGFQDNTASAGFATQQNADINNTDKPKRLIPYEASRAPGMLIALAQLIPLLVGVQLPLFAIQQEVSIVIEWSPDTWGHRFMFSKFDASLVPAAVDKKNLKSTIVEDEVFLVMDTLLYPSLMDQIKDQIMSRGGYSIGFDDVITQSNFVQYDQSKGDSTYEFQIPLASRRVKRLIVQKQVELDTVVETLPAGYYNSVALRLGESYNFRIDNNNVYSVPLSNTSLQRSETDLVEGVPMVLSSNLYSFKNTVDSTGATPADGDNITKRESNTHAMSADAGSQHYIGLKIENSFGQGHLMGIHPVIYTERSSLTGFDVGTGTTPNVKSNRVVRFFAVYQKVMNINNGLVEVIS